MDIFAENSVASIWLLKYGSFILFIMLSLGIIALPIPEEALMVVAGIMMRNEKLPILPTTLSAYLGALTGISMSYLLGRSAGSYLLHKYGHWVGITQNTMERAHQWFEKLGKWLLVVGYFIPGVRHLTGFSAGTTQMKYQIFACFAYMGAILWVSTFLSVGYFAGTYCTNLYEKIESVEWGMIAIFLLFALFLFYLLMRHRKRKA